jgi:hypothetical protein
METGVDLETARYLVLEKVATILSPQGKDFTLNDLLESGGVKKGDTGYHNWIRTVVQRLVPSEHIRSVGRRGVYNFFRWNKNEGLWADEVLVAWCLNPGSTPAPAWNPTKRGMVKPPARSLPAQSPPAVVEQAWPVALVASDDVVNEAELTSEPSSGTQSELPVDPPTESQVEPKLEIPVDTSPVEEHTEELQPEFTQPELGALALVIVKTLPSLVRGMRDMEAAQNTTQEKTARAVSEGQDRISKNFDTLMTAMELSEASQQQRHKELVAALTDLSVAMINLTRVADKMSGDNESLFNIMVKKAKSET